MCRCDGKRGGGDETREGTKCGKGKDQAHLIAPAGELPAPSPEPISFRHSPIISSRLTSAEVPTTPTTPITHRRGVQTHTSSTTVATACAGSARPPCPPPSAPPARRS